MSCQREVSPSRVPTKTPVVSGRRVRVLLSQALLVGLAAFVYFAVRALTQGDQSVAVRHAGWMMRVERTLGLDVERALQSAVVDHPAVVAVANWVYIFGHWPVIVAVLIWLAMSAPAEYFVYRDAMILSGLVGIVIFAVFPVAPPRLSGMGYVDTVTLHSDAYRVLQPPSLVNHYAAMPSFHVGWDLLMGIALFCCGRHLVVRALGVALPVAMAFSVVATANHWVLDVLVGCAITLGCLALARRHRTISSSPDPDQEEDSVARDRSAGTGTGTGAAPVPDKTRSDGARLR